MRSTSDRLGVVLLDCVLDRRVCWAAEDAVLVALLTAVPDEVAAASLRLNHLDGATLLSALRLDWVCDPLPFARARDHDGRTFSNNRIGSVLGLRHEVRA